jgi:glutaredoxin
LCNTAKDFLKMRGLSFTVIDSDEYLFEDRDGFIAFIESIAKKPTGGFPKVFADGVFVGGYAETKKFVSNRLVFDDNCEF